MWQGGGMGRITDAEFEVIDTGPGIQPDDLERIFAPFARGALGLFKAGDGDPKK